MASFTAEWASRPVHRQIERAFCDLPDRAAETLVERLKALFGDSTFLASTIASLADEMRDDAFFEPPFRHINNDIHQGLILYEDENVTIAVGVTNVSALAGRKTASRAATSITFSGQVDVFKFVRCGDARLGFWECPPIADEFSAAVARRCRRVDSRDIADGEIIVLDGRSQSFVIEHAASNLLVVQATVKRDRATVSVEYDSKTGEYVGCSAADDSSSRIQMIATLLGRLGSEAAVPALAPFLDHPNFFVRWHVMRELLGIDAEAALPRLRRMAARDPHPETRRTARRVLDRIESGELSRRAA